MSENIEPKKKWTTTLRLEKNEISKQTKKSMTARIITSIVLTVILVPAIFVGGWFLLAVMAVAICFSVVEILQALKVKGKYWLVYLVSILVVMAMTYWPFIKANINTNIAAGFSPFALKHWSLYLGFTKIEVSAALIVFSLCALFLLMISNSHFGFDVVAPIFLLILFLGMAFQAVGFLRFNPYFLSSNSTSFNVNMITSSFLIVYVILGTIANDIGAYFMGVYYGKNKMNPRISPNKTWEGFVGGLFISIIISFAFGMIVSALGAPIIPSLTHKEWPFMLLLSLVIALVANLGDLFFSAVKRHFQIKDYGFIIVGHGGVLDRIDSLLLVSVVTSAFVMFLNNGWSFLS